MIKLLENPALSEILDFFTLNWYISGQQACMSLDEAIQIVFR